MRMSFIKIVDDYEVRRMNGSCVHLVGRWVDARGGIPLTLRLGYMLPFRGMQRAVLYSVI